jgi:hypothetical protein
MRHRPAVLEAGGDAKGEGCLVEGLAPAQADAEAQPMIDRLAIERAQAAEDRLGTAMLAGIEEMLGAGIEHRDDAAGDAQRLGQGQTVDQPVEDRPPIDAAAAHCHGEEIAEERQLALAQAEPSGERKLA